MWLKVAEAEPLASSEVPAQSFSVRAILPNLAGLKRPRRLSSQPGERFPSWVFCIAVVSESWVCAADLGWQEGCLGERY